MTNSHTDEEPLSRVERRLFVVLPLAGFGVAYLLAYWITGPSHAQEMAAAAAANFLGLGSTVIFGGAVVGKQSFNHLSSWDLALVTLVLDGMLTIIYVGVSDVIESLPWAGPRIASARRKAKAHAREHPWIRHWTTLGIGLFILSPSPGSGVTAGVLLGHIVGLSRWRTFLTVTLANVAVCALYAWGAEYVGEWMRSNHLSFAERLLMFAGGLALIALLVKLAAGGFHRA